MPLSVYWANAMLDHALGIEDYDAPATIYVGLSQDDPLEDGSGIVEPTGGSYARAETTAADWNAASDKVVDNANQVAFPSPTASWGTCTHFFLHDGEHFLGGDELDASITPISGQNVYFLANALRLKIDRNT